MTELFNDDTPGIDPTKNYLEDLVGEGRKFKTPEDLAKGKIESDAFIERLKSEMAGLREDLKTRTRLEEVLEKIQAVKPNQSNSSEGLPVPREPDNGVIPTTPEDIEAVVEKALKKQATDSQRSQNLKYTVQKLQETFGPNYSAKLKEQAKALDVGEEFLKDLASSNPRAFLKLVGADRAPSPPQRDPFSPPRTEVNADTGGFKPNTGERTKSYYDNLRKQDGVKYWAAATQIQLHKDAVRLGEAFFDN